ncbi:MAG: HEAT repeat domain-containing protein [Propionibacteriaceae bacterium]|nr:HEAT repeat domain-containing protein [Propionibacteriaceae bacterium]
MPKLDLDVAERLAGDYAAVTAYLRRNSGLPGPRSNLELLSAAAELLPGDHARRLRTEAEEYLRCCGVITLGREYFDRADDRPAVVAELTGFAADDSWRVRESVAMAGQRIGDHDFEGLVGLVWGWLDLPDPLVARAAVAAICEPRLIRRPEAAAVALSACARATELLLALPPEARRLAAARTLRQALGYCWSVAVAADPSAGLPVFTGLTGPDPDLAWIVRTNRSKARLAKLL